MLPVSQRTVTEQVTLISTAEQRDIVHPAATLGHHDLETALDDLRPVG